MCLINFIPSIAYTVESENQQSISFWESKVTQDPSQAINYFNLGVVYQKQSQFKKAVQNYNKVIQMNSGLTAVAIYYKAKCFEATGHIDKAKEIVSKIDLNIIPEQLKKTILAYKNKFYIADFDEYIQDSVESTVESVQNEKRLSFYLVIS